MCRVTVRVRFPTHVAPKTEGTLADGLEEIVRVPTQTAVVLGSEISIRPLEEGAEWESSLGELSLDVAATNAEEAVEAATEPFEAVIESLSFQLQAPLQIEALSVVDARTEDAGEPGQFWQRGGPEPFPIRRFRRIAAESGGVVTRMVPDLALALPLDARHRAAHDWYLKALAARFEMDRFIFFWIAMEILWRGTVTEKQSWDHRGSRIQAFLGTHFGVPKGTAERMWEARQVVHGDLPFDSQLVDELSEFNLLLRIGVNVALKAALGLDDGELPLVHRPALSIQSVGFGGTTTP